VEATKAFFGKIQVFLYIPPRKECGQDWESAPGSAYWFKVCRFTDPVVNNFLRLG